MQILLYLSCYCSITQSCLTLCNPTDCSTPAFPILHHLPELAETHVYWVDDAIQPSHSLLPPSPPAPNLSQHQGLYLFSISLLTGCLLEECYSKWSEVDTVFPNYLFLQTKLRLTLTGICGRVSKIGGQDLSHQLIHSLVSNQGSGGHRVRPYIPSGSLPDPHQCFSNLHTPCSTSRRTHMCAHACMHVSSQTLSNLWFLVLPGCKSSAPCIKNMPVHLVISIVIDFHHRLSPLSLFY